MPMTLFDIGYGYNMAMPFALSMKSNNTKLGAYEVVKTMSVT